MTAASSSGAAALRPTPHPELAGLAGLAGPWSLTGSLFLSPRPERPAGRRTVPGTRPRGEPADPPRPLAAQAPDTTLISWARQRGSEGWGGGMRDKQGMAGAWIPPRGTEGQAPAPGHSAQGQPLSGCSLPRNVPKAPWEQPRKPRVCSPGRAPSLPVPLDCRASLRRSPATVSTGGLQRRAEAGAGLPQARGQLSSRVQNPEPLWPPCCPCVASIPFPPLVGLPVHTPCTRGVGRSLSVGPLWQVWLGLRDGGVHGQRSGPEVTAGSWTVALGGGRAARLIAEAGGPGVGCGVISQVRG